MYKEKDISDLLTDVSRRTQGNWKVNFGIHRTKQNKALIYLLQDFYRISRYPTIVEMNEVMFIEHLDTAIYRADIIKKLIDQSTTKNEEAFPDTFESENKWK